MGEENLILVCISQGGMFQVGEYLLIVKIEVCIVQVVGVLVEYGEGFQVLNYQFGGEYQLYFDFFNLGCSGEVCQFEVGGQCVVIMVIYLNSVQVGGVMGFLKFGLEVVLVKGNVVFFVYKCLDGMLDEDMLYVGLLVECGEKWIVIKWLCECLYCCGV